MKTFWVVFVLDAPTNIKGRVGGGPGSVRFETKAEAVADATSRANKKPGSIVGVFECVGTVMAPPLSVTFVPTTEEDR